MVTYPDINPVQQGLTSVNRREPVFPFGDSRTLLYILFHTERKQFLIIKLYTVFSREAKDSKSKRNDKSKLHNRTKKRRSNGL